MISLRDRKIKFMCRTSPMKSEGRYLKDWSYKSQNYTEIFARN